MGGGGAIGIEVQAFSLRVSNYFRASAGDCDLSAICIFEAFGQLGELGVSVPLGHPRHPSCLTRGCVRLRSEHRRVEGCLWVSGSWGLGA